MTRDYFNMLFDETINDLDFNIKKLVFYSLKLDIENKMKESVRYRDAFEEARYLVRGFEDIVAVEGHCFLCNQYISTVMKLLDYRASTIDSISGAIVRKCPNCGMDSTFLIAAVL
jgi:hypothetical protein